MANKNLIVTVAREHGGGGRQIAQEVARQLKLPFVDSQIIKLATQRLDIPPEELAQFDEKVLPQLDEISRMVTHTEPKDLALSEVLVPDRASFGLPQARSRATTTTSPDPDLQRKAQIHQGYHKLVEALIKDIAAKGGSVILGRGANFILKNRPNTLHLFIHAPLPTRLQRLATLQKLSHSEAEAQIKAHDAEREKYVRYYHHADWRDPSHYTLTLNTAHLTLPSAVSIVTQAAKTIVSQKPQEETNRSYERLEQESYTLKEAADLLWTSPDLLRQAIYRGELKVVTLDHKVNRISRAALIDYLHNRN